MTREIWSASYDKALPISVQDVDLTAVLPAVFYMFRFGQRRGKGKFLETFGGDSGTTRERKRAATIERVANKLASAEVFDGFQGETERAILGDLLLCYCLENVKHALGRQEQLQRVAPAHYMASWIDLPDHVSHLRYVPEMIVAMLADQKGTVVDQNRERDEAWFAIGQGFEENVLLKAFHQGVVRQGELANRAADRFHEEEPHVGLDQLLMIRLAQQLGAAPDKLRGSEGEPAFPINGQSRSVRPAIFLKTLDASCALTSMQYRGTLLSNCLSPASRSASLLLSRALSNSSSSGLTQE